MAYPSPPESTPARRAPFGVRHGLDLARRLKRRLRRELDDAKLRWRGYEPTQLSPDRQLRFATGLVRGRSPERGRFVVGGLFTSTLGLGEGARLFYGALESLGAEPRALNLSDAFPLHDRCAFDVGAAPTPKGGGVLVIHLNAPELPVALLCAGRAQVRRRRLIGYWHWELPEIPPEWQSRFALLDEVWAPTAYVARAIAPFTRLPVHVVGHPVTPCAPAPLSRTDFGLPKEGVVFLCVADALSSLGRKNIDGVIKAFRAAFADDPRRTLVIKLTHTQHVPAVLATLRQHAQGAANIRLLLETLQKEHLAALMAASDIVVSLHRSEGFGLVLAEGMLAGKAVIATGWSGNMDFTNADNAALVDHALVPVHDPQGVYTMPGQRWAEPKLEHATALMRALASDEGRRLRLGEAGRQSAARAFSIATLADALRRTSAMPYLDDATARALGAPE